MSATVAAPVPLPVPRAALRDFSDRLSPMLVKELRQGLKSPVFIWGLIAMQIVLAVMAINAMEDGIDRDANMTFWWAVAGTVCVLLPMRVANALRDEMGGNTMDTLVMTRLSAWRITMGKWVATGALQTLVAMTSLPYLIMRYFAGSVDLPMELAWLGIYLLFGLLVSGVMLGLSWFRYFLVRAIIMLGILFGAIGFCAGTISVISRGYTYGLEEFYREMGWPGITFFLCAVVWVTFFFLDLGAAQIAPLSENRATRRRLAALAMLTVGTVCIFTSGTSRYTGTVFAGMLCFGMACAAAQALCEKPGDYAPVLRPFVKRGAAGRLAGRLLYPGWHTGIFFTLFLGLACGALFIYSIIQRFSFYRAAYGSSYSANYSEMLVTVTSVIGGCLGALLLPLIYWRMFRKMEQWDFWRWLTIAIIALGVHLAIMLTAAKTSASVAMAHCVLPSGGLTVPASAQMQAREEMRGIEQNRGPRISAFDSSYEAQRLRGVELTLTYATVAGICLAGWIGVAIFMALRQHRHTRRAENELAAALKAETAT